MDKLKIMNRALSATGNNLLVALGKGDDLSLKAELAFDRAIDYLAAFHSWPFTTKVANLTLIASVGGSGVVDLPPYQAVYQMPIDCWHLRAVIDALTGVPQDHRIINNRIQAMVTTGVQALYLTQPTESQNWHPAATEVLTLLVEAEIYQGFNEDLSAAQTQRIFAENMLAKASGRVDQEDTPRNMYRSLTGIARRRRKI